MKRGMNLNSLVILAILAGLPACTEKPKEETKQAQGAPQDKPEQEQQVVVGRVTFAEKNLFRYLEDSKDWALAARDVPVGDGDVLYSDAQGRSEFTFPNDTRIRINDNTKIKIDGVKDNLTSLYVNSGVARIQNRSADTVVKIDTPYGQVLSQQPSTFDVYVGDSSAIVTGVNGGARFVDSKNNQYDVKADADSLLADQNSVASSRRYIDSRWDSWNSQMDGEAKRAEQNPSPYLPAQLQSETQALSENGNWEQLSYNGETASYWTPRGVAADWSPFTVGRWTTWQGEQLWVPYERFGWVTHHHGGWIFYNGRWFWRPPVRAGWRVVPWYPARVAWVNHGRYIGWVPLTAYETYYGRRYWGPRTVVYNERVVVQNISVQKYVNVNRVVVIDKTRLYGVNRRYETVRDVTVVRQVVTNGQVSRVVTRDVVRGADLKMEHNFVRSGDLSRRPRADAVNEFEARRRNFGDRNENAGALAQRLQKASLKTPEPRTNQPLPFAKSARDDQRNLPETPRELRKQKQEERRLEANTGRGLKGVQDQQPLKAKDALPADGQRPRQQQAELRRQEQQKAQAERQEQALQRRQQNKEGPGGQDQLEPRQQRQREAELRRQQQQQQQVERRQQGLQQGQQNKEGPGGQDQLEPRQQRQREAELRRQQQQQQQVERQQQQQQVQQQRQQQQKQQQNAQHEKQAQKKQKKD